MSGARRALTRGVGRRVPRAAQLALAFLAAAAALVLWASPQAAGQDPGPQVPGSGGIAPAGTSAVVRGRALYLDACSACHGPAAEGVRGTAPSLVGVGAGAVDFYLSTGRMPLAHPGAQPRRAEPLYGRRDIDALTAYITSLGPGGVPVATVRPSAGDVTLGQQLFADNCSGCHQIMGEGGMTTGAFVPDLKQATPTQIGEAIRIGPYLMPHWNSSALDGHDVDSIARYVTQVVQQPPDQGGWGIGHVGPIPEGVVAWFLLGLSLVIVARIIGERTT